MKTWFSKHDWVRRALRTFLQAAFGVVVAAISSASGVVENINIQAVIVLAFSTGLAAVMNAPWGSDVKEDSHE